MECAQIFLLFFDAFMFRHAEILVSHFQEYKAEDKQEDDAQNAKACFSSQSIEDFVKSRSNHTGKFSENVHKAKVLAASFRRNQLSIIAPAQCLNTALHCSNKGRQNPEQNLTDRNCALRRQSDGLAEIHHEAHKKTNHSNQCIGDDSKCDQFQGANLL